MLDRVTDYIAKERATVRKAPVAFIACILFGASIAALAVNTFYNERFTVLKEQIEDYKERLGLVIPDKTAYAKLTNQELKREASEVIVSLRKLHASQIAEYTALMGSGFPITSAPTERDRNQARDAFCARVLVFAGEQQQRYDKQCRARAILLRDELLRRLPENISGRQINDKDYEQVAGASSIAAIANDLEVLVSLMPSR